MTPLSRAIAEAARDEADAQAMDAARYEDTPVQPSWQRAIVWAFVLTVPLGALGCLIWAALPK
jgi:hypothetical protein